MSAEKPSGKRVTGTIIGHSALQIWGLTSEARLQRQLERAGANATAGAAATESADRVVMLRADWVYDESLVRGLAGAADDVGLRSAEGEVVALSLSAPHPGDALELLANGHAPTGVPTLGRLQIADGYNDKLRKREPPYLLPLRPENLQAIEHRTFAGAYKGVTDLVTLYAWPRPARYVTRQCARAGITPNQVTAVSLVLVLVAMWMFWIGQYATGLIAAWAMTFLDTVDGKLARVTLTSSRFGDFFDHSIDLVHPPFWWWAWIVGLPSAGFSLPYAGWTLGLIVAGYILQRLEEGVFIAMFGLEMHVWKRFDSRFRLVTARRNPNLLILTGSMVVSRPDWGIALVAGWTVVSLGVHALRLMQAAVARRQGPLRSWLASEQ